MPGGIESLEGPRDARVVADGDAVAERCDGERGVIGRERDLANGAGLNQRPTEPAVGASIDAIAAGVELAAPRRREDDIRICGRNRQIENMRRV